YAPRFFIVGSGSVTLSSTDARDVAYGWDGAVYVTDYGASQIVRVSHSGTLVVPLPTPTSNAHPRAIIRGPESKMWSLEDGAIASVAPGGTIVEYPIPTSGAAGLAWGPDGNLWFTDPVNSKIGRFLVRKSGDVDGNGTVDVADVFYLVNFLFAGG